LKYCIDYRGGGMGNTVLAHVLYSCEKVELKFDNFFSDTGDSHNIAKLNRTELIARHLIEFPDDQLKCIVQLNSDGWNQVLLLKMLYDKWHKTVPMLDNYEKFFKSNNTSDQSDVLWKEYYSNFKDTSWPECPSYCHIKWLPEHIQDEIYQTYQPPDSTDITNNDKLLEFLTQCYFDNFKKTPTPFPSALCYPISKYLSNDVESLKNIIYQVFGWKWNQEKSNVFYHNMISQNARYFYWLDSIKNIHNRTIRFDKQSTNIDIWERAIVIAKICEHFDIIPAQLHWNTKGCFLDKSNVTLINNLKEVKHGKTI
jgi:hypothetical protein